MNIPRNNYDSTIIRFGVMCDELFLAKWEVECIKHLLKLNFVDLKLIILNDNTKEIPTLFKKIIINRKLSTNLTL